MCAKARAPEKNTHVCVCVYTRAYIFINAYMYKYTYKYYRLSCACTCLCVCVCVIRETRIDTVVWCACVCTIRERHNTLFTHTHIHRHIYTYTHIHTHTLVCASSHRLSAPSVPRLDSTCVDLSALFPLLVLSSAAQGFRLTTVSFHPGPCVRLSAVKFRFEISTVP